MTVALVTLTPLAIVSTFGAVPNKLTVPEVGDVYAAQVGYTSGNYKLVDVTRTPAQPPFTTLQSSSLGLADNTLTVTDTYVAKVLTKPELIAYVASKRQTKMTGGTSVGGVAVATDAATLALISLAYSKALATGGFTMPWNNNGTWITLTNAQVISSAQAIGSFLGGCLALEKQAVDGINANTITTPAQVDAVFS